MNRRDFLKRSGVAAAITALPMVKAEPKVVDFPTTKEEMLAIIHNAKGVTARSEYSLIPDGLSRTDTPASTFWYYLKDDRLAVLHQRSLDEHECFYTERHKHQEPVYYPPRNNGHYLGPVYYDDEIK